MTSRFKALFITMSTCAVALLLVGVVLGNSPAPDKSAYRHLTVYTEVLSRIKSDYVEEPDIKSVTLGALNGLLESVDPFASYLNADQYKEYLKNRDAYKGGVGLILSKRFGYVGVVDAVPGSPADKAGLTTGDVIETIKGIATRDMPLAYANMLLQGKPGTPVEISILAMRHPEPKKIVLTRAVVQQPAVETKMLGNGIGYIRTESMAPGKANELKAALLEMKKQNAQKLIFDVRHCAAGAPEEGVAVADLFLDNGLIAYVQGQKSPRKDFQADASNTLSRLPMAVITNRGTSEGCEVAAAALLDNKRADVIGERTYGNASVRQAITMDDGGAIILSVAKYYSPSGKAIQDTGVTPNVAMTEREQAAELDEEGEEAPEPQPAPESPQEDMLLKKAIEVLTEGVKAANGSAAAASQQASPAPPSTPLNVPAPPKH